MSATLRLGFTALLLSALAAGAGKLAAADDKASPVTDLPPVTQESPQKPSTDKAADKAAATAGKQSIRKETPAEAAIKPAADKTAAEAAKPKPKKKVKKLSPDMTDRRGRVRKLLAALRQQPFATKQNDCSDVLQLCRGFGCDAELLDNAGSGQKVNGITCLCWNMPCAGSEMMTLGDGHLTAKVGYGFQSEPSEFAAVLALSDVPADYPARCARATRTVADIIEYEKLTCRRGADMSLKLVALAHYVREPSWKDNLGGEWTLPRVIAAELDRPESTLPHAATNRLLGLACGMRRMKADKAAIEGDLARAKSYLDDSTAYAYSVQNGDGSWGGTSNRDYASAVGDTARMLERLVAGLPERDLEDARIAQGIDFLVNSFAAQHYQSYLSMMNPREISAAMHAAFVLNLYDQRVFAPADPPADAAPAKGEEKKAAG